VIVWLPPAVGVKTTVQVAVAPLPLSVHVVPGLLKLPAALLENVTVPLGVRALPGAVSVTVTVQVVSWLALSRFTDDGEQETVVVVARFVTVRLSVPLLLANWIGAVSPAYVALSVCVPMPAVGV